MCPHVSPYLVTFEEGWEGIPVALGPSASMVASITPDGWASAPPLSTYPPFTRHGPCRRENALSGWQGGQTHDVLALTWLFFSWKGDCLLGPLRLEPSVSMFQGWHRGGSWLGKETGCGVARVPRPSWWEPVLRRLHRAAHSQGGDNECGEHAQ